METTAWHFLKRFMATLYRPQELHQVIQDDLTEHLRHMEYGQLNSDVSTSIAGFKRMSCHVPLFSVTRVRCPFCRGVAELACKYKENFIQQRLHGCDITPCGKGY
jgi:hypothetical protein